MKLPPGCWCFAREAGKTPTSWVNNLLSLYMPKKQTILGAESS
ncbi:hypothetical protein [Leptolyngbya sp. FACHB-16]|nr:hypothetical protein [Leptolyngbya sp. FACHB-16]